MLRRRIDWSGGRSFAVAHHRLCHGVRQQPWIRLVAQRVQLPDGTVIPDWIQVDLPDYVVAVPAGYLELGEQPLEAGARELLEETGYAAVGWSPLGSFVVDGNRGCGTAHLFLATGAEQVTEADSGDLEEMVVRSVALHELQAAVSTGKVAELSMATAICLAAAALVG